MAAQHRWLVDKRIILLEYADEVTIEQMQAVYPEMVARVRSGTPPVHLLCDVSALVRFPTQISSIMRSTQDYLADPAMGWLILIGSHHPLLGFIGSIVSQFVRIPFEQADDLNEALRILAAADPTLDTAALAAARRSR
jgi:hypothetical protein